MAWKNLQFMFDVVNNYYNKNQQDINIDLMKSKIDDVIHKAIQEYNELKNDIENDDIIGELIRVNYIQKEMEKNIHNMYVKTLMNI